MSPETRFSEALEALEAALPPEGWMVIGGVAVVARGVARTTRDLDIALAGNAAPLEATVEALARAGIAEVAEVLEDPARLAAWRAMLDRARRLRSGG